jgi:hypothetical protein
MLTRNQAKQAIQMFLVNIDFDEASSAWTKNKIKQSNGCYKYRCMGQTQKGSCCKRMPLTNSDYCKIHYNSESKI